VAIVLMVLNEKCRLNEARCWGAENFAGNTPNSNTI
jgi:hypothetical protein